MFVWFTATVGLMLPGPARCARIGGGATGQPPPSCSPVARAVPRMLVATPGGRLRARRQVRRRSANASRPSAVPAPTTKTSPSWVSPANGVTPGRCAPKAWVTTGARHRPKRLAARAGRSRAATRAAIRPAARPTQSVRGPAVPAASHSSATSPARSAASTVRRVDVSRPPVARR